MFDSVLTGNRAYEGGGIICYLSSCNFTSTRIRWNHADYYGGAFYIQDSSLHLYDILLENNTASTAGGGIFGYSLSSGASVNIMRSTIRYNKVLSEHGTRMMEAGG